MKVILKKQPQKYLDSVDKNTRNKLYNAIDKLKLFDGDIKKLAGYQSTYRYKIYQYRIIFEYDSTTEVMTIKEINSRTNIKY